MKQYMAGYYGSIEHADHQIGRVLNHVPANTIIIFTSDHGEMLGDHQWIRKRSAFEGSARIPYIFKLPDSMGIDQAKPSDKVVELMDIMPTVLDAAGVDIPESVDGASLMPLLRDEDVVWRDYIHGECTPMVTINSGMQFITDGKEKYIYYPGRGEEQFFDLVNDPVEMNNLIDDPDYSERVELNRARLINELDGRPENFVVNGELQKLNGPTPSFLPEYERRPEEPEARNMESPVF
jgi:arylsulfatase A-like enzyme